MAEEEKETWSWNEEVQRKRLAKKSGMVREMKTDRSTGRLDVQQRKSLILKRACIDWQRLK